MAGFEVAGRRFRTEADYRAALRDQAKINRIRAQVNMEQPGEVITLYSDMQSGKYRFETAVGNDFDDEIYELAQEFKRQGYNRDSRLTRKRRRDVFPDGRPAGPRISPERRHVRTGRLSGCGNGPTVPTGNRFRKNWMKRCGRKSSVNSRNVSSAAD